MQPLNESPTNSHSTTRLWVGIAVIVVGILAGLDNLLPEHNLIRLWPVVLIIMGIARISKRGEEKGISGAILILAGIFLLTVFFGNANVVETIWPFFIVALGVFMVTKALRRNRGVPPDLAAHDAFISSTAIFGGSKRRVTQTDFKGGELTAIFGGFELDLRQAALEGNQVRVDVFVLFGGGEIKIPQDWAVTMKGSAIMGAFEDKTLHMPVSGDGGPRVHLVITGMVLFGGLTVMN
jgi:predicted membrane protein